MVLALFPDAHYTSRKIKNSLSLHLYAEWRILDWKTRFNFHSQVVIPQHHSAKCDFKCMALAFYLWYTFQEQNSVGVLPLSFLRLAGVRLKLVSILGSLNSLSFSCLICAWRSFMALALFLREIYAFIFISTLIFELIHWRDIKPVLDRFENIAIVTCVVYLFHYFFIVCVKCE